MVRAPGVGVRQQHLARQLPSYGVPRRTIAAVITDDQIGGQFGSAAGINLIGAVRPANDALTIGVRYRFETFRQLLEQLLLFFAGFNNAVRLPSLQIQIQAVDPQTVGAGKRPIHVVQDRSAFRRAKVAPVAQPRVQIELHAEVAEAMIAHHEDGRPTPIAIGDVADHLVELPIQVLDVTEVLFRLIIGADGMLGVGVPPEDVRLKIAAGKVEKQQAVVIIVYGVSKEGKPFLQHHIGLSEKLIISKYIVLASVIVLLEAGRVEESKTFRYILDERIRLGYLGFGSAGIEVNRSDVELEVR